ncbi:hypothetical protein RJ639_009812 [Escallonia herrerae]|uniref:Reverse transcriptase Ty1/copia-type domain-containing protein n=1 Tax=Escallonia herrerae TaxID=1293975 RepID=A0AA89AUH1_9ASTE|nr:hypothetical protein RJ639_009812 [Escallonia herrerae]
MLFYLTTLNLARFLQEDAPDLGDNPDRQTVSAVDAWKHSDFLCKNILNGLDNALYNVYSPMINANALWDSLERKYKTEDAGSKKFVVGKFLNFKMVDSKTVISQVQEFQLILHDIHAEGMVLGESFQMAALIEKLSPTWKDFKNYLKHKRKEMKLEDLIVRLRKIIASLRRRLVIIIKKSSQMWSSKVLHKSEVDDIHVNTIMETRNAHFFEDVFPYKVAQEQSSSERTSMDQELSQEEDESRRSKRARTSTSFGPDFLTYLLENEPRTYSEAMSSPEASQWKEAINSEIESIMQNNMWELVDLPLGNKPLGCKWIFKRKIKTDGTIEKYRARLVVKGYRQKEGLDYFVTYSQVIRITSIGILIAIAAINSVEIHQVDVKTTFLNGGLNEEIYIEQPEGFIALDHKRKGGGTVYATPYVAPAHGSVGLGERPEKFNRKYFKRWQQKMLFFLTTFNLARFLQEDAPDLGDNPDRQTVAAVDAWKHSDFMCQNFILSGLDNALYDVHSPMVNAKELWESLERKYKTEDAGLKKFVVGKFLDFKMVDSKIVITQVQEFQLILHDIHAKGWYLESLFKWLL